MTTSPINGRNYAIVAHVRVVYLILNRPCIEYFLLSCEAENSLYTVSTRNAH